MRKYKNKFQIKKCRWKQCLSLFLILCMIFTMLPVAQTPVYAEEVLGTEIAPTGETEQIQLTNETEHSVPENEIEQAEPLSESEEFEKKSEIEEPATVSEAEQVTITAHFKNSNSWSTVNVYAGEGEGDPWTAMDGYAEYSSWPGVALSADKEHPGYYTVEFVKGNDSRFNCIFNNGNGTIQLI